MTKTILVIEDEPAIADNIIYALKTEGFEPVHCTTGKDGLEVVNKLTLNLIVLDIGLPDLSGFELCKTIRKASDVPIIFLTARSDEVDRIVGLEIGGDDYMTKPFSPRELTARIKAILRRTGNKSSEIQLDQNLQQTSPKHFLIDNTKMIIYYHKKPLELSRYEYKILETLLAHPGRVFSRSQLMHSVWDVPDVSLERSVDSHIKSVRNKLKMIKPQYDPIETRRGFGYALKVDS